MSELAFFNRQRVKALDLRLLRRIVLLAMTEILALESYELGVHLVGAVEMARVNEQYLNHSGSTDVITFDYAEQSSKTSVHGEVFVCLDDALKQAREFGTTWQSEVVRYIVHGILHLLGFDDMNPSALRLMKQEENRIVKLLASRFAISELRKTAKRA